MGGFGATLARQHLLPVVSLCSKVQPMAYKPKIALPFLLVCTLAASPLAQAGSALAVEMGCYSCHGNAYHPNAPSFAQLASHTAKHRGEAGARIFPAEEGGHDAQVAAGGDRQELGQPLHEAQHDRFEARHGRRILWTPLNAA